MTSHPPQPGYRPGPSPYAPRQPARPGLASAAAVLAFVAAGLLIVAGLMLIAGASVVSVFDGGGKTAELTLCSAANFVAGGLLIAGGVGVNSGKASASRLYAGGAVLVVIMAVYWVAQYGGPPVFWAVVFVGLVITGACFVGQQSVRRWLRGGR